MTPDEAQDDAKQKKIRKAIAQEVEQQEKIFDSEPSEEPAGSAKDTDTGTETTETKKDEPKQEIADLDLTDKKGTPTAAEIERQKQIDTWTRRVIRGEVGLDDLPLNLQWLKGPIQDNLDAMDRAPDIGAEVARQLEAERDRHEFQRLKEQLKIVKLSVNQRAVIESEYNELRSLGSPKSAALDKAMKIAKVDFESFRTEELKKRMAIPETGKAPDTPDYSMENWRNMPESKRLEYYEKIRKKEIT